MPRPIAPTVEFGFRRAAGEQLGAAVAWLRADPAHRRVFVSQPDGRTCFGGEPGDAVKVGTANRRDWYLANARAIAPACFDPAWTDRSP